MKLIKFILSILIFLPSLAFSENKLKPQKITKIPESIKAQYQSDQSNIKNKTIYGLIEKFEKDPNSEQAHTSLASMAMSFKDMKLAKAALSSLKALNPKNSLGLVYEKHLFEIEALGGKKIGKAMRKRQTEEMFVAAQEQAMSKMSKGQRKLVNTVFDKKNSNAQDDFLKLAKEAGEKRNKAFLKKYPELCKEKIDYSSEEGRASLDVTMKLNSIRSKKGTEGLKAYLTEEMKQEKPNEVLIKKHIEFLLREKKYEQAQTVFNDFGPMIKKGVEKKVISSHLDLIKKAKSTEDKEAAHQALGSELMTLGMARIDCH